ncbi:MAG: hypothetical protein MUC91_07610 [Verrucomicrobia bacterium]|nr:hypothetical protein [Verrucomicrobiota bacterium]
MKCATRNWTCSASEISIHFRAVPHQAFPREALLEWQPARLTFLLQPDQGLLLHLQAKQPGQGIRLRSVNLRFNYAREFKISTPDAYETLLLDVIRNDPTQFMRFDQVETAWRILQPILNAWASSLPTDFPNCRAGSWGPPTNAALPASAGHSWPQPSTLRAR